MADSLTILLPDSESTTALGEKLSNTISKFISAPESSSNDTIMVFLQGDLGAGKTTFSRGVIRAFGHTGAVKSPTYTLVEPYDNLSIPVFHFDLYRLSDPEELEFMGFRDYLDQTALLLIEWPSKGDGFLPEPDLVIDLRVDELISPPGRTAIIQSNTNQGQSLIKIMAASLGQ